MRAALRLFCFLLAGILWLSAAALAAPSPFRVLDYDTRIEIEAGGDISVTEDITIDIPTSGTNKGIIRDLPVNPRWRDRGRQDVRVEVQEVSIDGKACRTDDTETTYPVLSIYMRDRAQYLDAGQHRFRLRFRMSEQLGFFDSADELTWNAVGEHWAGGVQHARATILPPPGTEFTDRRAWLGKRGSQDSPVNIREEDVAGRKALVFEAARPIREGEALTCAVAWPKGIVTPPQGIDPAGQWGYTLLYGLLFLVALAAAHALWSRYGRDPEAGAVIPLYYPPKVPQRLRKGGSKRRHEEEYMTAVAVHYVNRGGELESRGLSALFLSLAQRGDCSLRGSARKNVVVTKHSSTSPAPEERAAADKLPQALTLTAGKGSSNPIGKVYEAAKLRLDLDYPMVVRWHIWPQLGLLALLALLLAIAALCQLGGLPSGLVIEELGEALAVLLLLGGGAAGLLALIGSAVKARRLPHNFFFWLAICGGAAVIGSAILPDLDLLWIFSAWQWAFMSATLAVPAAYSFLMDAPTREQVTLRQEIKGLALYIGTAESARFNFANPPEENLSLYHRLLPYAVALGLEDAWGKRFADQLADALGEAEYYSRDFTQDLLVSTRVSFGSYREAVFAEQAAKYASSSGGGSSFGGFGGGAGSGGGGGGRAC